MSLGQFRLSSYLRVDRRDGSQRGTREVDLGFDESATTVLTVFELAAGLPEGFELSALFPVVHARFRGRQLGTGAARGPIPSTSRTGHGDLLAMARYRLPLDQLLSGLSGSAGLGLNIPLGGGVVNPVSSERNFVTGTVDPVAELMLQYHFDLGLSLGLFGFVHTPVYANDDGRQSGETLVYGLTASQGLLDGRLSLGARILAVNRLADERDDDSHEGSGGDFVFLEPMVTWRFNDGLLQGLFATTSVRVPVYQYVRETQLRSRFTVAAALGYTFSIESLGAERHYPGDGHDHGHDSGSAAPMTRRYSPRTGDFSDLVDDGSDMDLAAARVPGKVTIFDFWAEWCAPCKEVTADLARLSAVNPKIAVRRVNIVDMDSPIAQRYLQEAGGIPHLLIFGPEGEAPIGLSGDECQRAGSVAAKMLSKR